MLEYYINDIKKYPPLERQQELALIRKGQEGDIASRDFVIHSNLRFVFQIAKAYQGRGMDFEDLLAEGNIGLIKAFERFDPEKEIKFISYAVWWVRQTILNALYKNVTLIRIPVTRVVAANKVLDARQQLERELQREPTFLELKELIDDPEALRDMENIYSMVRIDMPRTETGEANLHGILYDEEIDEDQMSSDFTQDFKIAIKNLSAREKEILQLYYGVGYLRPHTLREIGAVMGLTRERVRQIKQAVLDKLKKRKDTQRLKDYI